IAMRVIVLLPLVVFACLSYYETNKGEDCMTHIPSAIGRGASPDASKSFPLDAGRFDHLGPFFGKRDSEAPDFGRRACLPFSNARDALAPGGGVAIVEVA